MSTDEAMLMEAEKVRRHVVFAGFQPFFPHKVCVPRFSLVVSGLEWLQTCYEPLGQTIALPFRLSIKTSSNNSDSKEVPGARALESEASRSPA